MQAQITAVFCAFMVLLLVILNIYPVVSTRDAVIRDKEQSLTASASVISSALAGLDSLNSEISATAAIDDATIQARSVLNRLLPAMQAVRSECDALERIVERKQWPFPTYAEMMWTY